ncbi:MAG: response regulator [Thermodesulfobacteriota bacterium]|nr:response regulator [Thermodesulfobacteriota bacterium]
MAKETILILDNEFHNQWFLRNLLETEKYMVVTAHFIEKARSYFSEFEITGLITEYWIDQTNSLKMIQELKKMFPATYVMMLTNHQTKENEYEEIIQAGVDDFFLKPFSYRKILLHLRKGLDRRNIFLQKMRLEQELNQNRRMGKPR